MYIYIYLCMCMYIYIYILFPQCSNHITWISHDIPMTISPWCQPQKASSAGTPTRICRSCCRCLRGPPRPMSQDPRPTSGRPETVEVGWVSLVGANKNTSKISKFSRRSSGKSSSNSSSKSTGKSSSTSSSESRQDHQWAINGKNWPCLIRTYWEK